MNKPGGIDRTVNTPRNSNDNRLHAVLADAKGLGYNTVRLESLRALAAAHNRSRSVGFVEIEPYVANSMDAYQDAATLPTYRKNAVFMEAHLEGAPS